MSVVFNDAEFKATAAKVSAATGRTMAEQLNRMAYFIARAACRNTPKVSKETIARELGEIRKIKTQVMNKRGKFKTRTIKEHHLAMASDHDAPLAAILINAKLGDQGKPGLKGLAMTKAIEKFIAARQKSRAFLASGWIPAIKYLSGLVRDRAGAAPIGAAKLWGMPEGGARAAAAQRLTAAIWNTAGHKTESGQQALDEKALPALEQAMGDEQRKSKAYWERKLAEAWRGAGAKVH